MLRQIRVGRLTTGVPIRGALVMCILLMSLVLTGCAGLGGGAQSVKFKPAVKGRHYPKAKGPARVTTKNRIELYRDGYVRVGELDVSVQTGRHGRSGNGGTSSALLKMAPSYGAQLVAFIHKDEPFSTHTFRKEATGRYDYSTGHQVFIQTGTREVSYSTPMHGSRAVLWRKEPAAAARWLQAHPLQIGLYDQNLKAVRAGLKRGTDPNTTLMYTGETPLLYASRRGFTGAVNALLDAGADYDKAKKNSRLPSKPLEVVLTPTPLQAAFDNGHVDTVKVLIHRCHLIKREKGIAGYLRPAAAKGDARMLKVLLEAGLKPNATPRRSNVPLFDAVWGGHREAAELLLKHGANPDGRKGFVSPLMAAARRGDVSMARRLLEAGADPNYYVRLDVDNPWCCTPADNAIVHKHPKMVALLKRYHARTTPDRLRYLRRPHHPTKEVGLKHEMLVAAKKGDYATVKRLLDDGMTPNLVETGTRMTPLYVAAQNNHPKIVRLLLERGADVNFVSGSFGPPILGASGAGAGADTDPSIVRMLLDHGAKVNVRGILNITPLIGETDHGHLENMRLLLKHGAKIDARDNFGQTAIYKAILDGNIKAVELLLQHKASLRVNDKKGDTPYGYAVKLGQKSIAKLIQRNDGR